MNFIAGAPRTNYTGQVVVYTINSKGNVTILQIQRGEQVCEAKRNYTLLTKKPEVRTV